MKAFLKWITLIKKKLFLASPYLAALGVALIFLYLANKTPGTYRDLLINLSASFITIPLVLIFIDSIKNNIDKNLKQELFNYSKKNIDNDILSTISHINKLFNIPVLPITHPLFNLLSVLLRLDEKVIRETMQTLNPLGFQLFKNWGETKEYFSDVFKNPLSIKVFTTEQISTLIKLLEAIQVFESDITKPENITLVGDLSSKYVVMEGTEITSHNASFSGRWLLLQNTDKKDEKVVKDFGDFDPYYKDKLLNQYKFTEKGVKNIGDDLITILELTKQWLKLTDNKFLLDFKRFKGTIQQKPDLD